MGIRVLSLFDGISCGQIALERVGIEVDAYYASEIEVNAMKITQSNYPNTIQIGDVSELDEQQLLGLGKIDVLIGGSPCTNLSRTTINNILHNQGLDGEKSKLFYEYVRVMHIVKPKFFLLENVESMKKEDKDIITDMMGVEPMMINSAQFSAQDRKRYYWTNIPIETVESYSELKLKDIVQDAHEVEERYWYKKDFTFHGEDKNIIATLHINGHDILKRVSNLNSKSPTLTTCSGGNTQKKVFQDGRCRKLTPLEYERLQNVPDNYTSSVATTNRYNCLGNGWTVDVIAHIFKGLKNK